MKIDRKKIGLFGGTFDPIHFGHLNLALELMEKRGLDEVWFVPTLLNPHKASTPPTSFQKRCEMVALAIEPIPFFFLKEIEKDLPSPSYTLNTVTALMESLGEQERSSDFFLMIGEDALSRFMKWNKPEKIIEKMPLLIGSRSMAFELTLDCYPESIALVIQKGMIGTRLLDISSTDVRSRLANGKFIGHLLPAKVIDYIENHSLYLEK